MSYTALATKESVAKTAEALRLNGIEPIVVKNGAEALEKIKALIPAGASVMNGASKTLEEIGYLEYLKSGQHGWNNLHAAVTAESDPVKRAAIRKAGVLSDFYLGSVHALTEGGESIIASNSGSQLPHIVFTSPNVIFMVSTKKIVPTLAEGMKRLEEYVTPLEDARMMETYKSHTQISKIVIFKKENTRMGRKVRMILVEEGLGF